MKPIIICLFAFFAWSGCANAQNLNASAQPEALVQKIENPTGSVGQNQLQQVHKMLASTDNLSGNFKQVRKMQLLSDPLVSSGHFVLSKTKGLKWYQTTPFKSTLIVTASKIEQQLESSPPVVITKEQQPVVFSFTNIFLSVFNGDTKTVSEYFDITFTGNTSRWNIILKPNSAPLNKAIASIEMSGGKYINYIAINETKNNQTIIRLYNAKELQK
jgi:hypothetical protein